MPTLSATDRRRARLIEICLASRMADKLAAELRADGVRVDVDTRFHLSFGRRVVDWELKGVPVRVELGTRELAAGQATLIRWDARAKCRLVRLGGLRAGLGESTGASIWGDRR
jgi:prolyl-tRNA synthetase